MAGRSRSGTSAVRHRDTLRAFRLRPFPLAGRSVMRLVPDPICEAAPAHATVAAAAATVPLDPSTPDLGFLINEFPTAMQSFFGTLDRIDAANPVAVRRLLELACLARAGTC